jgi:hypothetical protein
MATTRNHRTDTEELTRRDVLLIATLNNQTEALHRLRQAAFGLDRQDRIALAERISAMNAPRRRRRQQSRSALSPA